MADFIVTGPLDPTLVRAFNCALDATFELGKSDDETLYGDDETLYGDYAALWTISLGLGERLLGSSKLAEMVINSLADGPAEGDVLAALSGLYDQGIVDFDSAVYAQILRGPDARVVNLPALFPGGSGQLG